MIAPRREVFDRPASGRGPAGSIAPRAAGSALALLIGLISLAHGVGATQSTASQALAAVVQELEARQADARRAAGSGPSRDASLSWEAAERSAGEARALLARLDAIDASRLSHEEDLTLHVLQWNARAAIDQPALFWYSSPLLPASSPLTRFLTGAPASTFTSADSLRAYLDDLGRAVQTVVAVDAKTRGSATRSIILPDEQIDRSLSFLEPFAASSASSPFAVAGSRLAGIGATEAAAFQAAVARRIDEELAPAARDLIATLTALGPQAPNAVGWAQYPGGKEAYRIAVRLQTTLEVTPEEVHAIGLDAVADIERQMAELRRQLGFTGTRAEFHEQLRRDPRFYVKTPDEFGAALMAHIRRIEPLVSDYFSRMPAAPYGVARLHPALEPSQTYGHYARPSALERRGLYNFNGSQLSERSLLTGAGLIFHELIPGHHFQINLQGENTELPAFRRSGGFAGYVEGWGEYSSSVVAREMGMYTDPYDLYGRLVFDNFFAVRLVVDTGMNYYGWSRPRAMLYMREHTLESDVQIDSETIRYSTRSPAQALAYRMGRQTFVRVRERAAKALGARFDIRRFHDAVLTVGALPLVTLERHVDWWIRQELAR